MSALGDFAKEQKNKAAGTTFLSQSFSSFGDGLKSKLANPLGMLSRSETADDTVLLTEPSSSDGGAGQLPFTRNRKASSGGWLGPFSSDVYMCGLSRIQRIVAFFMFIFGAGFCFMTSMMLLPVLVIQTRKFAALNTLGSTLMLISFCFLWGPSSYVQHLLSPQRRIVTVAYISTVLITLYTSLWLKSTLLTIFTSLAQLMALIWFVLSYVPGGERGLRFITTMFGGVVKGRSTLVLPV